MFSDPTVGPNASTPYKWEKFSGNIPANAVKAGNTYAAIRVHHENDWIVGKLNTKDKKAYIPYDEKEVNVTSEIEILVPSPGATVEWVPASNGQVPQGAVGPFGNDGVFVGRATCPAPENEPTPGKIHPGHKVIYIPFDGKETNQSQYEVCVIKPSGGGGGASSAKWEKFNGKLPDNVVLASNEYAVIKGKHENEWIPGKMGVKTLNAWIAFDMKEVEVKDIEVLTASASDVQWVAASDGQVPDGAVGPLGPDHLYIGRTVCPAPESVNTPGKVHPEHKRLYLSFSGKEISTKDYEVLVVKKH